MVTTWLSLLFLLPPSCMVAPIGNTANKFSFSSNLFNTSTTILNINTAIPAMSSAIGIGMNIQTGQGPVSDSTIRGRNSFPFINLSRESSLASSGHSTPYHDRMDTDMDFPLSKEELNLELSYKTEQERALRVSMAANQQETTRPLPVRNKAPSTHVLQEEEVINI